MKICRFIALSARPAEPRFGVIRSETVFPLSDVFADGFQETSAGGLPLADVRLLAPVTPSKIVCVGRNYAEHARELGNEVPTEPLLFLKAPSAVVTNHEAIIIPPQSNRVEHEGELAVIVKRTAKNISEEENPLDYVLGYTCLNDVTARDIQRRDVQFTRGKSFDTFCPVLDFIETELDPTALDVTVRVGGAVRQQGNTAQMVFPVADLIRYISRQMTLLPGDVIATGTPAGVSQLTAGDVCEVEIEGIGVLRNPVRQ